uniref:hypothetical protein n=1 Tax=Candidatus Electronema sp. TaxID=2698783 RepID=UPI004056406A
MTAKNPEMRGRRFGHVAVVLFLLAVFLLAVLCVGIGLTWLAPQPKRNASIGLHFSKRSGNADCHSLLPAV